MVMYQNDHPIQWTPAYVGGKVSVQIKNAQQITFNSFPQGGIFTQEKNGKLMTTVSTPVFDRRNHSVS